jgi:hypothetical protein
MRRLRGIGVALTVVAMVTVASASQGVNVTGKWVFDVQTGGGGGQPTVTFTQDGEKITGHYSSQTLGEADFTGTLKGNAIQFSFNADVQGNAVDVAYAGTVDGNTMKGTVNMAGGQLTGSFSGKKQ